MKNNMSSTVIKINDGKLKMVDVKETQPLTLKYLEKTLGEIIKNESQLNLIMNYIKQNREVKTVTEIKRYFNN
jgi:hypothetical protein